MKLLIDISKNDYEEIKEYGINTFSSLAIAIQNGTPLETELKSIKEDMKDTFYNYKNNRYDVSMEGILDFLDKRIEENNNEIDN